MSVPRFSGTFRETDQLASKMHSGDRKVGAATANVGRQWLGRLGKTDNGIVMVTTVWTDGRLYHPLEATPCTPCPSLRPGPLRPGLPNETATVRRSRGRGNVAVFGCRAVVADCGYSATDTWYLALRGAGLAQVGEAVLWRPCGPDRGRLAELEPCRPGASTLLVTRA